MILAVCSQLKQLKKQPEKNSGLNGSRTHDLAIPVQCSVLSYQERCTGIARSWVRVPFKPEFFFRLLFELLKLRAHCEDHNFTHVYPQFTYMISYIYIHIFIFFVITVIFNSLCWDQFKTRRCGSVYLGVVVLDILECIYLGNLHARQFRV